jgi:hypothetical protein
MSLNKHFLVRTLPVCLAKAILCFFFTPRHK